MSKHKNAVVALCRVEVQSFGSEVVFVDLELQHEAPYDDPPLLSFTVTWKRRVAVF